MALSRQERVVLVTAGVAVAGLTALALFVSGRKTEKKTVRKKNYGIRVTGAQCNTFEVTDAGQLRQQAANLVANMARKGPVDPFEATRVLVTKINGGCTTYPSKTRNPGEALLFVRVFEMVLDGLVFQKLVDAYDVNMWKEMVEIWALNQGVSGKDLGLT